jgi:probable addiction module antidote protein
MVSRSKHNRLVIPGLDLGIRGDGRVKPGHDAKGGVSHREREIEELREDRELAVDYLRLAMESLDDPEDRAAGLLALRTIVEAYGGLGAIAAEAGISRESLYRALSPKGNPTLKTMIAVLKAVGMRLSVEPAVSLEVRTQ